MFVLGTASVALVLLIIHTDTGFARLDRGVGLFGAHHATTSSTRFLQHSTQLGGALVTIPRTVIVAVVGAIRQRPAAIATFFVAEVGGQFLSANVLKAIVD